MTSSRGLFGLDVAALRRGGGVAVAAGIGAVLFLATAIGFAAVTAQMALARHMDPIEASAIVAVCALLLAVVAISIAARAVSRARRDVNRAVTTSALVTLGPPLVSAALRHKRLAGLAAMVGLGIWIARRVAGDGHTQT